MPPLDPKRCIAAYKVRKKLSEPASSSSQSQEQGGPSSEGESSTVIDEDSKASTCISEDIAPSEVKMTERPTVSLKMKKRRYIVQGRNPRKSPRQHASTLAILSSLVQHRKRRSDLNRSRGSSDLNDSKQSLPTVKEDEEREDKVDYEEMERDIERLFEADDKYLQVTLRNII